jgi:hypothetical protein
LRTELCRQQAEVIENSNNEHVHRAEQEEARYGKYKMFKFGGSQAYDDSSD